MRNYERNQVMVDQCTGCGGLFLDRGELERLYSAESAFYEGPPPAVPRADSRPEPQQPRYEDHRHSKPKKSRKRSFLEEFFE